MEYWDDLGKVIGILVGIATVAIAMHTFISNKLNNRIKEYEIYKEVRQLLEENQDNRNLASIQVALRCIISRELTLNEIVWFIKTPNAFKYIRNYSAQARYLTISKEQSGFSRLEKYNNWWSRMFERLQIMFFYICLGTISAVSLAYGHLFEIATPLLMVLYGFGIACGFLAIKMLELGLAFSDTDRMINRISFTTEPKPELELIDSPTEKSA